MKGDSKLPPIDWVKRVNRAWLVRGGLELAAEKWLAYLASTDPQRLKEACAAARAMCGMRDPLKDPKPWFYAGLFSRATADEIGRFIPGHRVTKAAVPAMRRDSQVVLWLDRVGDETRDLVRELRAAVERTRRDDGLTPGE